MKPLVSVAVHDVSVERWPDCERLLRAVHEVAPVRVTLLAVPLWRGRQPDHDYEQWLHARSQAGDEIALHGCTHVDDASPGGWLDNIRRRIYTAGEGEFAALDSEEASRRLQLGIDWFRRHQWPLDGFIAPAWLLSEGTWTALTRMAFRYTCTLNTVVSLTDRSQLHSRSLVYSTRAAWRRAASIAWAAAVVRTQSRRPLLRVELHPADIAYARVRRSWMRHLEAALRNRQAVTLAEAARLVPSIGDRRIALGPS